jgi:hypothetical protein
MLAQLVTDEAKPGSKEKWYVDCIRVVPLVSYLTSVFWFDDRSRLRTYTFVLLDQRVKILHAKPTGLGTETSCPHWESM